MSTPIAISSADLNAILAPTGWALMDVTVNTETGFARVVAERRDYEAGTGIKVTLLRSSHAAKVVERRDVVARRPGMYRDFWEVTDASFGGRRVVVDIASETAERGAYAVEAKIGRLADTALRQLVTTIA